MNDKEVITKEHVKNSLAWDVITEMKKDITRLEYINLGLLGALIISLAILFLK
jgi:hypothetical protein